MMKKAITVAMLAILAPAGALAQGKCELDDNVDRCWDRYLPSPEAMEAAAADESETEVKKKNTGIDSGGLNLSSTTKNFLPLLAFSGLLGNVSEGENDGTFVIDFNPLLGEFAPDKKVLQVQGTVNTQPTVSEAVQMGIPEDQREDTVAKLEKMLGDLDDYAVSVTFNWLNETHGRNFAQYRDHFANLAGAATSDTQVSDEELTAKENTLAKLFAEFEDAEENATFREFSDDPQVQERVRATVEDAARATADLEERYTQALQDRGLNLFADLVNNQPQLHVELKARFRDELVGGDEESFKLTYEMGAANLNKALGSASCKMLSDEPEACLADYTEYVRTHKDAIMGSARLSFSAEYSDVKEDVVNLPDLGLNDLNLEAATKLIVSVGLSRNWKLSSDDEEPTRIDLEAKYEDVSDDPMRQDRLLASLTFARKFGGVTVPFGIVYANHSEFLTGVDEQLSAHIGLRFSLDTAPDNSSGTGSSPR